MTTSTPEKQQSKPAPVAQQTEPQKSTHPDLQRTQGEFGTKVILDGPHKTDWL